MDLVNIHIIVDCSHISEKQTILFDGVSIQHIVNLSVINIC